MAHAFPDNVLRSAARWAWVLWQNPNWMREPEDRRIRTLEAHCRRLCNGDKKAADDLFQQALDNAYRLGRAA